MATAKGPVAIAHTSALPYSRGGPISVVEMSPQLRARTDEARTTSRTSSCRRMADSRSMTTSTTVNGGMSGPTYGSQRAMRAAAAAAATAQQGYDNIYMLEMLEDDAIDAIAAEIKDFALEWIRGGIAWWKASGVEDESPRVILPPGAGAREGVPAPAGLIAEAARAKASQKKLVPPPPVRPVRWTKHSEVKRKEEEQRARARQAARPTPTSRSRSMPSLETSSNSCTAFDVVARPTFPPAYSLQDPLKPLPALPTEEAPKQEQQASSYGSGRRHSAPQVLRRRRAGGSESTPEMESAGLAF
ncbi:hypothetical protein JCM10908_002736 [Rhodotorula pacifica]|uniref:uncharacterized protein n=1 Tax=Rhodotorula pacifica TaxID=1495444 RepID=UPI0031790DE8